MAPNITTTPLIAYAIGIASLALLPTPPNIMQAPANATTNKDNDAAISIVEPTFNDARTPITTANAAITNVMPAIIATLFVQLVVFISFVAAMSKANMPIIIDKDVVAAVNALGSILDNNIRAPVIAMTTPVNTVKEPTLPLANLETAASTANTPINTDKHVVAFFKPSLSILESNIIEAVNAAIATVNTINVPLHLLANLVATISPANTKPRIEIAFNALSRPSGSMSLSK